jgi:predicted nucleic-acid-binding Zn-ribbon protein
MMADNLTCPKCKGAMEQGVIPDQGYGKVWVSSWQRNSEKGFFGSLKTWKVKRTEIAAYRCMKCGYLESYARD